MKHEFDYGWDYAEFLYKTGQDCAPVDINAELLATSSIPDGDYTAMVADGVDNPDPAEYWEGFNEYAQA